MNIDKPDANFARPNVSDRPLDAQSRITGRNFNSPEPVAKEDSPTFSTGVQALIAGSRNELSGGIDAERVESIRQAIEQGTYHVDTDRLAQRFLDLETVLDQ